MSTSAQETRLYHGAGSSAVAEPPVVVYEFQKNAREVIRATLQEFHGRRVFDLRVWLPRSRDGALVPGAKGLTVDRSLLPQIEQAIQAARAADRTV